MMDETGDGDVHWRHAFVGCGMVEMRKSRRNKGIVRRDVVGGWYDEAFDIFEK